jgi:hypothetical protein
MVRATRSDGGLADRNVVEQLEHVLHCVKTGGELSTHGGDGAAGAVVIAVPVSAARGPVHQQVHDATILI